MPITCVSTAFRRPIPYVSTALRRPITCVSTTHHTPNPVPVRRCKGVYPRQKALHTRHYLPVLGAPYALGQYLRSLAGYHSCRTGEYLRSLAGYRSSIIA
eukprot:399772-Rhodomonas_salina.2